MSVPTRQFPRARAGALSAGVSLCLWLAASAVGAQPEATSPAVAPPALEQRAAAPAAPPRVPAATAPASAPVSAATGGEEIELAKTRDRRRAARRAKLEALWGDLLQKPPTLVELQLHGWRMARLRRLGRLAAVSHEPALVERITRLEAKEEARHGKQLNRLKQQAAPPSAAPQPRRVPTLPRAAAPASAE